MYIMNLFAFVFGVGVTMYCYSSDNKYVVGLGNLNFILACLNLILFIVMY